MKNIKLLFFLLFPLFIFPMIKFEEPWGKDSDLYCTPSLENDTSKKPWNWEAKKLNLLSKAADKVITFKQKVISPIDGPRSSFRPTSSRYMQLAMYRYGFFKGFIMGCDRLLRENGEKWCYRTIVIDNVKYKYDPAIPDKYYK